MADQMEKEGGFPQQESKGQSTHSTTGDAHRPRPGEPGYERGEPGRRAKSGTMKE
jgi:hypothetical protein